MFKKKQPEQGRVRQTGGQGSRQAFSYYTSVSPSTSTRQVTDRRTASTRTSLSNEPARPSFVWLRYGVLLVCLVVASICLVKLLLLAPSSRIVLSGDMPNYARTSEEAYARKADQLLADGLLNRSKITLDTNGISEKMKQAFPELESVVVTVPIVGNRPVIYIAPAHAAMRLETASGTYLLSAKGYAFKGDMGSEAVAALPQLLDLSGVRPTADAPFLPVSTVTFASAVHYQLIKAGVPVESLMLPQEAPYELDVRVAGKPYSIKFNLEEDPVEQSGAALAVLKQLNGRNPGSYVDVRVPGRAYYK